MKKITLFFIVGICLISLVSAGLIFEKGQEIDLKLKCLNENLSEYCTSVATCNLTIYDPKMNIIINNKIMTNNVHYHNYTINKSFLLNKGEYIWDMTCIDGTLNATGDGTFLITESGTETTTAKGLIMIIVIVVLIIFSIIFLILSGKLSDDLHVLKVSFLILGLLSMLGTLHLGNLALRNFVDIAGFEGVMGQYFNIFMYLFWIFSIIIIGYTIYNMIKKHKVAKMLKAEE